MDIKPLKYVNNLWERENFCYKKDGFSLKPKHVARNKTNIRVN
jgi:hypothetical protein